MKKYKFRPNSPYKDDDADAIGKFLEQKFPDKKFNSRDVVEIARPKNSPIHDYFEWDDTIAAERYRIRQAQQLVAALYIEITDSSITKAYEALRIEDVKDNVFVDQKTIETDVYLTDQVIQIAYKQLIHWKLKNEKYRDVFGGVLDAIEDLEVQGVPNENETPSRKNSTNSSNRNKSSKNNSRRRQPTSSL